MSPMDIRAMVPVGTFWRQVHQDALAWDRVVLRLADTYGHERALDIRDRAIGASRRSVVPMWHFHAACDFLAGCPHGVPETDAYVDELLDLTQRFGYEYASRIVALKREPLIPRGRAHAIEWRIEPRTPDCHARYQGRQL